MVYLIHFEQPIGDLSNPHGQAQHYLGYTDNLEQRIQRHRSGNGSALMAAVADAGIGWSVVRTWPGDRSTERKLKRQHNNARFCPVCNGSLQPELEGLGDG